MVRLAFGLLNLWTLTSLLESPVLARGEGPIADLHPPLPPRSHFKMLFISEPLAHLKKWSAPTCGGRQAHLSL